jgi:hypothetical protein
VERCVVRGLERHFARALEQGRVLEQEHVREHAVEQELAQALA